MQDVHRRQLAQVVEGFVEAVEVLMQAGSQGQGGGASKNREGWMCKKGRTAYVKNNYLSMNRGGR